MSPRTSILLPLLAVALPIQAPFTADALLALALSGVLNTPLSCTLQPLLEDLPSSSISDLSSSTNLLAISLIDPLSSLAIFSHLVTHLAPTDFSFRIHVFILDEPVMQARFSFCAESHFDLIIVTKLKEEIQVWVPPPASCRSERCSEEIRKRINKGYPGLTTWSHPDIPISFPHFSQIPAIPPPLIEPARARSRSPNAAPLAPVKGKPKKNPQGKKSTAPKRK